MRYFFFLVVTLLLNWIVSCSGSSDKKQVNSSGSLYDQPAAEPERRIIKLVVPEENAALKLNSGFNIIISPDGKNDAPDSVRIWFDGRLAAVLRVAQWEYSVPPSLTSKTGRKALKVVAYSKGSASQTLTRFLIVYADKPPGKNGYQVVKEYRHDEEAFTQGLVYHGGLLYEGTGQETRSSLRKVEIETGQVLSQLNLEPQLFGEGIAILGKKIYQLTWQSKVGFVYDLETFRLINRIYYQTEGWGLTTMGDKLVMSDGSNILYIIDPESFTVLSSLEVYDHKVKVSQLNELEYINGEIWANIWQSDLIARIDPGTGKVIAYIDLKGILKEQGKDVRPNELNGIAWDSAAGRIFVTGKNWPKLFEIKLTQ